MIKAICVFRIITYSYFCILTLYGTLLYLQYGLLTSRLSFYLIELINSFFNVLRLNWCIELILLRSFSTKNNIEAFFFAISGLLSNIINLFHYFICFFEIIFSIIIFFLWFLKFFNQLKLVENLSVGNILFYNCLAFAAFVVKLERSKFWYLNKIFIISNENSLRGLPVSLP